MDPAAQDVARCDVCETVLAQSYCDFCHTYLCKPCIGEHILDEYEKHKIIPFQQRKSTLIYPKCETHQKRNCEYQCKDCNISVCYSCLASGQHAGHELQHFAKIFRTLKERARKDSEELENVIYPAFDDIAIDLEGQLENLDEEYEILTIGMSEHKNEMYKEIDIVFSQMEKEINKRKTKHRSILKNYLDDIKDKKFLVQQNLVVLNEIEDTNDVYATMQYVSKNKEFRRMEREVQKITMPKFNPGTIEREMLQRSFGTITPSFFERDNVLLTQLFLAEPEIISKVQTRHRKLRNVTCLDDENIWTTGDTADIKCFTIQDTLVKTIKTKSGDRVTDLVVDKDGCLLYSDWTTRTVYKVKGKQTKEIIRLQGWVPGNLCVTSTGELLMTMHCDDGTQSKVERYSESIVKQIIQFDDKGQSLFSENDRIKYINENRNLDVCVADCSAGAVVVVNQAGKLHFRYTGNPSLAKPNPFRPRGITTDSMSSILTADGENRCIHIIDENGHFLRYIDNCNIEDPYGLCIDNHDHLFVCDYAKGNVKKIRYSK